MKITLTLLICGWLAFAKFAIAHGGEEHGEAPAVSAPQAGNILTITAAPDTFEVFVKYSPVPSGDVTKARLFISSYRTNVPVDPGSIALRASSAGTQIPQQPKKLSPGIYEFTVRFAGDSSASLSLEFNAGEPVTTTLGSVYSQEYAQTRFQINLPVEQKGLSLIWYLIIGAVVVVLLVVILRMKSRNQISAKSAKFIAPPLILLSLAIGIRLLAHGGEDHSGSAPAGAAPSAASLAGGINVLKETQFALGLTTDVVAERGLQNSLQTKGVVRSVPARTAEIFSPIAGRVSVTRSYKTGDLIRKGEALFTVQQVLTGTESLALEQELAAAKRELDEASRDLERKRALQDVISRREFELAEIRESTARTRYTSLQSARSKGTQSVKVTAPITGYLTFVDLANGIFSEPSKQLMQIVDVSVVWVEVQVYESDIPALNTLSEAIISAASGESYRGRFISRNKLIDPTTRALSAIFEITNPGAGLPINSTVEVAMITGSPENAIAVSKKALLTQSGKTFVVLHTAPEEFRVVEITTSKRTDEQYVEARTGVTVGDRVVTTNFSLFRQSLPM